MDGDYQIVYVEKPEESAWGIIGRGIREYNTQQAGEDNYQRLCFVLNAPDGGVIGGVIGTTYWGWFHLDLIWVEENHRGCGYGQRLLEAAESEARRRGARHVYLDTFSFQAPGFYEQYGYRVFGELPDFPTGYQRYFMTKEL